MKFTWFFSFITKAIRHTPMYGRTITVLWFVFLFIKQFFLYLSSYELLKEASLWWTMINYLAYFVSDFFVFLSMLALVVINRFLKKKIWRIINNMILFWIFFLFVLDIFTMYFFQSRLSILDLSQFIEPSLWQFSWWIIGWISLFCVAGIGAFLFIQSKTFKKNQKLLFYGWCVLFAAACIITSLYAPSWFSFPDNILSINFTALKQNFLPAVWWSWSINDYQKFFTKIHWRAKKPNVIIVFAESLSAVDSLRDGGTQDNLPYFDKIQAQGITFKNFVANGCTSDTAHIALLQGVEPWKFAWQQDGAYTWYISYTEALPKFFAQQWYTPIFISSVDMDFLNQRAFLSEIGFTTLIGDEAFKNKKKYVFDAAPDQSLYTKTLEIIQQQKHPYLVALQTISFHKPYDSPYGSTEKDALRYADKSLYYFYQQLKKNKFFDNGILIIVGDHRKMEPLGSGEKEALGNLRYARSVATILGAGITPWTINTNIIQHTDFFYALKQFVGWANITVSKLFNDVFSFQKKRNRGIVFCRYYPEKYGIAITNTGGQLFAHVADIKTNYPFIYRYIQAYTEYQNSIVIWPSWSGAQSQKKLIVIAHQWSWSRTDKIQGNSLEAFLLAKTNGADGIEFDISQTKDKQNVVAHGQFLTETVCGKYDVTKYTLEYLQKNCPIKNGEPLMTLGEMLAKVKGLFDYYFVEIKVYNPADAEQQTLSAIKTVKKLGMSDNVIFTSYDKTATYLLWSYNNIHAARDTYAISELDMLPHFAHEYYLMSQNLIQKSTPQEVEDMGKKIVIYTVNTFPDLERLYHLWVRIMMTDDVLMMREGGEKLSLEEK